MNERARGSPDSDNTPGAQQERLSNFYCPGPQCKKIVPINEVGKTFYDWPGAQGSELVYFHKVCGATLEPAR